MRRQQDEAGTLLLGLPDGLRRLDAAALCRFIFCQDDAVALRRITADRDGKLAQVGMTQKLAGGVKAVAVAVQNDAVHRVHLVSRTV